MKNKNRVVPKGMARFIFVKMIFVIGYQYPELARTQRGGWKNKITFSMFYHLEHHLFPAVPTIKLPELA